MPDGSDNFIEYDFNNPAAVFSESEIAFMEAICAKLSVAELQKVRAVEHAAFNKTTQRSSFHVLPGIRNIPDQGNIYFSRFSTKIYRVLIKDFWRYSREKLTSEGNDEKYWALSYAYRIIIPSGMTFYPITFLGKLDKIREAYIESARMLGCQLAEFDSDCKFALLECNEKYRVSDLTIETLTCRTWPKGW